jgi:hypothetical protein
VGRSDLSNSARNQPCRDRDYDYASLLAGLESIAFVRGDFDADDYWSLIHHCRKGALDHARPSLARYYESFTAPSCILEPENDRFRCGSNQFSYCFSRKCVERLSPKEDHINKEMAAVAPHFWAAVEDCLVTFRKVRPCEAAEIVSSLWRRLPTALDASTPAFADMIYHAEPWQIACNLANHDLPIVEHKPAYQALLLRNGLIAG